MTMCLTLSVRQYFVYTKYNVTPFMSQTLINRQNKTKIITQASQNSNAYVYSVNNNQRFMLSNIQKILKRHSTPM